MAVATAAAEMAATAEKVETAAAVAVMAAVTVARVERVAMAAASAVLAARVVRERSRHGGRPQRSHRNCWPGCRCRRCRRLHTAYLVL